jgi:ABC-type antimicrobial peptide transport system permease subunit
LLSFTASQRTMEIGIRMALGGAQRWQVVALVLCQSFVLIGIGIAAGLVLTFAAQRILPTPSQPWKRAWQGRSHWRQ